MAKIYDSTGKAMLDMAAVDKQAADILLLDERKADIEGSYESMAVGSAKTLEDNTLTAVDFTKRVVPSSVGSGIARLSLLKGNTLVWNQMIVHFGDSVTEQVANGVTWSYDSNTGLFTFQGTCTETSSFETNLYSYHIDDFEIVAGHKYLLFNANRDGDNTPTLSIRVGDAGNPNTIYVPNNYDLRNTIITASGSSSSSAKDYYLCIYFKAGETYNGSCYFNIFDLTRMFGEGNEPSSVEEFEALFPHENYSSSNIRLVNFQGHTLKSTGFNVWDEEWESGYYDMTGAPSVEASSIRSKNYCACLPNSTYYVKGVAEKTVILFYDENYTLIQRTAKWNATIVSPAAARYFKLSLYKYGSTYYHDICINISDPSKNGTYKPYMEDTLPLNVTTLKGKAEGSDTEVVMFPDGLRSAGSVYDEIDFKNGVAIKSVGSVDLGTLKWGSNNFGTEHLVFYSVIADAACTSYGFKTRALQAKYEQSYANVAANALQDKQLSTNTNQNYVYVRDDSYPSSDTFKTAMNRVMLYYELATPIVYHFEPMNNVYRVEQGGTEEVLERDTLAPEGYNPLTAPMRADIRYGVDVVGILGNLKKDYVSKESIQVFLSALGTQMGGTWSMTWNETAGRYDFVFTPDA